MQSKLYFNPPNSELRLPLEKNGEKIKFAFFEVGCKPHRKRGQVFLQEQSFRQEWKRWYQKSNGIKWQPSIHKYVVHFMPEYESSTYNLNAKLNGIITCNQIPSFLFSNTTEDDSRTLFKKIRNKNEQRILEGLLNVGGNEELSDYIINSSEPANLRGYSAELYMQKSIAFAARRTGVKYTPNYTMRAGLGHTEIDMLVAYYDNDSYKKFIDRIKGQPHLKMDYDRFKIHRPDKEQQPVSLIRA